MSWASRKTVLLSASVLFALFVAIRSAVFDAQSKHSEQATLAEGDPLEALVADNWQSGRVHRTGDEQFEAVQGGLTVGMLDAVASIVTGSWKKAARETAAAARSDTPGPDQLSTDHVPRAVGEGIVYGSVLAVIVGTFVVGRRRLRASS